MTKITKVKTGSQFEVHGSYSRLVEINGWIHVSNTAGRNPQTKKIPEDLGEQTLQVFANIERALAAVDASLADVVFSRVFVQNPEHVMPVMDIVGEKFRGIDPATTVTCPPLGTTEYKVELEVTAYRGAASADVDEITLPQQ
ncbi:Rid family hydrolase [Kushneria indalinina]|uniref:Enamine deaminase RidA (YjgF/YER057c/UK114 family) n=1 Tax=Kushneria indalinina DSM 14324 TaxID=1122140 RepID=A0A3D9DXH4_9GAMM|nr:Rid family hydrolase [Kushneria indalinina]REC94994.1 enamine deaminase RidA (YjgF/YER057c/UK114 family) [Kushneria indalinina DSM 14324]